MDNQAVGFGGEARRWPVETSVTHKRTAHDTPPTMEGPRKKQNRAYKNEYHAGRACACVCVCMCRPEILVFHLMCLHFKTESLTKPEVH